MRAGRAWHAMANHSGEAGPWEHAAYVLQAEEGRVEGRGIMERVDLMRPVGEAIGAQPRG